MRKADFLPLILLFLMSTNCAKKEETKLNHVTGLTMGTITYNVKYLNGPEDLKEGIDSRLKDFNQSLSTYISDSEISKLNRNGQLTYASEFFYPVLQKSREIFLATSGTFDPSVGPLVQAWGFGPNKEIPSLDPQQIDSLKAIVGFDKVSFDDKEVFVPENHQLDFSAIAKGYAVDLVAEILEGNKIENYLVEIGGEVRAKGVNEKGASWSLGIEDPLAGNEERRILAVVRLKNRALATSGNYRNYYIKDGRTYAHIIDPRTGYNSTHNLLSASVFAEDCISADAYATAFMVLGADEAFAIVNADPRLDAILVYQAQDGSLKSLVSSGIKPFIEMNKAN
ncbi:MAG: FAD:protein FMN transferase [Cyclobacteriaceae bacterium]